MKVIGVERDCGYNRKVIVEMDSNDFETITGCSVVVNRECAAHPCYKTVEFLHDDEHRKGMKKAADLLRSIAQTVDAALTLYPSNPVDTKPEEAAK
jgi:hypothetical protein